MSRTTLAKAAVAALGATVALAVTACGSNDDARSGGHGAGHSASDTTSASSGDAAGEHNDADVTFAQQMIPHHRQAVEMADLVATRTTNEAILDLASQIKAAQDPEIQQMTALLQTWGADVPGPAMPGMDHGSHGGGSGMMTDEEMQALADARDTEFDRQWASMMIRHHEGAIDMANAQLSDGANPKAKTLAQQIIDTQEVEIRDLQALLPQG